MIIKKTISIVSSIISWTYGFSLFLILDMINRKPYFNPIFRCPTSRGIARGVVSVIGYLLIIIFLGKISKSKSIEFILTNCIAVVIGLILFRYLGLIFFVDTDTGP